MGKKRLVIDLTDAEHDRLVRTSRKLDLTLSNYVRRALRIPLRKQGVKHPEAPPPKKVRIKVGSMNQIDLAPNLISAR